MYGTEFTAGHGLFALVTWLLLVVVSKRILVLKRFSKDKSGHTVAGTAGRLARGENAREARVAGGTEGQSGADRRIESIGGE